VESWQVPSTALREALLNAISHKDYNSNVPIQISVYHEKLMLWNPGGGVSNSLCRRVRAPEKN